VSTSTLTPKTYNATLLFTNSTNNQGTTTRLVTLTVTASAEAILQLSPTSGIAVTGNPGGPYSPTQFTYQLSSTQGTVNYSIIGAPNWLSISAPTGNVGTTGTTVTFQVNNTNANTLVSGTYNSPMTIKNMDTDAGTTTLNATITITAPPPLIYITPPTNLVVSGDQGGPFTPTVFTYTIKAQLGTINWSISGVPSWLTPSATSGQATSSGTQVTFTVNANSQAVGNYPATITFTNSDTGSGTTTRTAN
jgi:hypothetical protein